ncbi:flavin-containing monooxygenase [Isoalcanivorax beigongshangi]|uniref:Flavin-containing monooxygenase n=1 Tax=Isoalcanivorax beigongshangi TaxID=3238810 RepID=A0ABV4ADL2_9GAMM
MSKQQLDVLIIGAGLSGIGMACHLTRECPDKRYAILEGRDAIGGTWDLFRYPGIRSDSDMFTLGYSFRPWTSDKAIADGPSIRQYINDTADEYGVRKHIHFNHRVLRSNWNSAEGLWEVTAEHEGKSTTFSARFVVNCTGYYRYEAGYTPEFPGRDSFKGQIVHPQLWPEDLDYQGKKVIIIGSGATAVTLVPALAQGGADVTMLQRSPSYVASVPESDHISIALRKFLPESVVYRLARARNVGLQMAVYRLSKMQPKLMRKLLMKQVELQVGKEFDMTHFDPKYNPWDERLCAVPNGDLFKVLRKGQAQIVTDHIETFNENGILLKSGQQLDADIIITATGLQVQILGGAELTLDDKPYDLLNAVAYKGLMFSDLPNAAMVFGYTNSSWTLKADISAEYVCRLLNYMEEIDKKVATPRTPAGLNTRPFIDMDSGYVQRARALMPKQGDRAPWQVSQTYAVDLASMRLSKIDDGAMEFSNPRPALKKAAPAQQDAAPAAAKKAPAKPRAKKAPAAKKAAASKPNPADAPA